MDATVVAPAEQGWFARLTAIPVIGGFVCLIVGLAPYIVLIEMQDRGGSMSDNVVDFWGAIFTFFWLTFVEQTTRVRITLPLIPIPIIWLTPLWLVMAVYHMIAG